MDVSQIPKSFWHSLSFCMVVATLGLLFIAYKASSVSIEIANTKIELSSALTKTKEIKSELEKENDRLKNVSSKLEEKILSFESKIAIAPKKSISVDELKDLSLLAGEVKEKQKISVNQEKFKSLDMQIQSVQQALEK